MRGYTLGEVFKVSEVVAQVGGDVHAVAVSVGDAKLQCAKEPSAAWDGRSHEAELAKEALPHFEANPLPVPEGCKYGKDPCFASVSEFEGTQGRVEDPAKDLFLLHPATVTL